MRRFFVRPEDVEGHELRLRGDEVNHLARVLRLGRGAQVVVFNGQGHEYVAMVERFEADGVVCRILCDTEVQPTRAVSITLGQGLPKAEKFAWVIQKTTELGVSEIVPLLTERVVPHVSQDHIATKVGRWEKLAREACKQSGRATVPNLWPPTPLQTFFTSFQSAGLKLVLWEGDHRRALRTVLAASEPVASVAVVVGPEGGLTAQEVARGEAYGFLTVGLGNRILRTETAGLIAVALLQYQFGDLGS
jgi:16S rRNA (uracil1498-N3)-methyltransferase